MAISKKKGRFGIKALIIVAAISLVVGVMITAGFDFTGSGLAGPGSAASGNGEALWTESAPDKAPAAAPAFGSFAELAAELMPAVVNISSTQVVKKRHGGRFPEFKNPFFEEFFKDDFFKHRDPDREIKRPSLGSGFIINSDGYIITNYHVIEDATEIIVTLSNNETKEYEATLVGKDKKIDIALIKIEADEELPVVPLGDSDGLLIGQWVLAIGNPFGLGGTVTAGIVSQKGRVIGSGPYDDFIQTDASINPGNSGGPLFNLKGEVVGINTAIVSGGTGIGFAVPVNMAKQILTDLRTTGSARRGWLGVAIQELSPELAKSFGIEGKPEGVLISSVMPGDPADKAGIKAGDIIIEFDGKETKGPRDLQKSVAATVPGKKSILTVIRDGKKKKISLAVGKQKDDTGEEEELEEGGEPAPDKRLGLSVDDITPAFAEKLGVESTEGVLVMSVEPDSPAADAGIRRGDIIKEVNRKVVKDVKEYNTRVSKIPEDDNVLLRIKRGHNTLYVAIASGG